MKAALQTISIGILGLVLIAVLSSLCSAQVSNLTLQLWIEDITGCMGAVLLAFALSAFYMWRSK